MLGPLRISLYRPYRAPSFTTLSILGLTPQDISHHPFGVLDPILSTPFNLSHTPEGRYNLPENPKSEVPNSKQIPIRASDLGFRISFTLGLYGGGPAGSLHEGRLEFFKECFRSRIKWNAQSIGNATKTIEKTGQNDHIQDLGLGETGGNQAIHLLLSHPV